MEGTSGVQLHQAPTRDLVGQSGLKYSTGLFDDLELSSGSSSPLIKVRRIHSTRENSFFFSAETKERVILRRICCPAIYNGVYAYDGVR